MARKKAKPELGDRLSADELQQLYHAAIASQFLAREHHGQPYINDVDRDEMLSRLNATMVAIAVQGDE